MVGSYHWALAPYNNDKYPEVQTAIVNAVKWLQGQMTIEAGFAENSQYNENSCSTAQVLTALSVAGIDAVDPANGFTVGKKNMITNLWSYRCEDGGFYWDPSQETKANEMGTYQVTYALESYRRFAAKENSLYDLTDVATNGKEETPVDAGTITVAAERFAIGQGYLIEPYTTTFKKGDTYADICERILKENGFTYTLKGDAFYLSGIDHADSGKISIPECIQKLGPKKVGVNNVNPPDNTAVNEYAGDTAWLGEFSYSKMAGWMYSVGNDKGHEFPGVGMDGKTPEDGDIFRLQFTVWGYGEDLTGVEYNNPENVYYEVGDKTALTKEIAHINADKKNWISAVDGREEAYNNAMEVLQKLDATQAELDAALELLKNPVSAELQILTQPEDYTGAIGETAVFKVEAEGEGLSYQWQYCKANSDTWKKVSGTGSKTAALSVKISKTKDGQKYRCVITDKKGASVTSDAAVLKIGVSANAPKITGQPEDYTGTIGETAVFKVEAEGEGLSYQWQYCKANSSMWKNVSGAGSKTAALSVEITKAADGQKYRCVVTNKAKLSATSDAAVLKVEVSGEAPKITGQPEDYAGAVRETAVFKVEAEGEGLSYQWQYCKANSDTWKKVSGTGSKTASLSVKISKTKDGQKYRCVITDAAGRTVTSEAAVLTVNTQ